MCVYVIRGGFVVEQYKINASPDFRNTPWHSQYQCGTDLCERVCSHAYVQTNDKSKLTSTTHTGTHIHTHTHTLVCVFMCAYVVILYYASRVHIVWYRISG